MNSLHVSVAIGSVPAVAKIALFGVTTLAFGSIARLLRGVTFSGAAAGCAVCFLLMLAAGWAGFAALCTVFVLTWAATRLGYRRKHALGVSERRGGRDAGQVLANLGIASLGAIGYLLLGDARFLLGMSAALAEVAADTISSEIGLVLGGTPRLATTWKPVPIGTDGAVTWPGTLAGVVSAVLVSSVFLLTRVFTGRQLLVCAAAGVAGTIADSLLGATLERKGLLGNNAVNFLATTAAFGFAWLLA